MDVVYVTLYSRFQVVYPIAEKQKSNLTNQMQAIPKHHRVYAKFDWLVLFFVVLSTMGQAT